MVIAVPDSGTVAAIGYAEESGIPFGEGSYQKQIRRQNFYPAGPRMRELSVRLKLNVLKDNVKGKRIVMVDDSIVRGTTSGKIVKMLKDAGAWRSMSVLVLRRSPIPVISESIRPTRTN